tara:strand:+ start:20297 stop:21361 length:1065 start_codon:yes stop_codon:yes gene_type:complete
VLWARFVVRRSRVPECHEAPSIPQRIALARCDSFSLEMGLYLFSLARIPVSVSGWYFALIAYYAYSAGPARGLLFGLCVTVSLLVHEFGHALVARHYRLDPEVLLHGLGGLCSHKPANSNRHDAFIIAAGPFAGLFFGGLVYLAQEAMWSYRPDLMYGNEPLQLTFSFFLYITIIWNIANLLPLWPLDGGQLFRLLMVRLLKPSQAERATHYVGIAVGAVVLSLTVAYLSSPFLIIIVGFLMYKNFTQLNAVTSSGPLRRENRFAKDLLNKAETALKEGDADEAARVCHQLRTDSHVSEATLEKIWAILAVASYAQGDQDEADSYAERAPDKLVLAMLAHLPNQDSADEDAGPS